MTDNTQHTKAPVKTMSLEEAYDSFLTNAFLLACKSRTHMDRIVPETTHMNAMYVQKLFNSAVDHIEQTVEEAVHQTSAMSDDELRQMLEAPGLEKSLHQLMQDVEKACVYAKQAAQTYKAPFEDKHEDEQLARMKECLERICALRAEKGIEQTSYQQLMDAPESGASRWQR